MARMWIQQKNMIPYTVNVKIFLIIGTISFCQSSNYTRYCEISGDDISKHCYTRNVLLSISHSSHQLAVDRDSDILYFSFDSGYGEYIPALLKIKTKELTELKGVRDSFAVAYDPTGKEIYFGGTHGIYRFSPVNKSLKRLNIKHLDVWWLFVKTERMYFIKFPNLNVYSYYNGSMEPLYELKDTVAQQFLIDKYDNTIFINNSGIFAIKFNEDKAELLRDSPRFINMALDNHGQVYVCSEDGIYSLSQFNRSVMKIINIHGVLGLTFDQNNNMIYSDSREIVRLMPTL